MHARPHPPEAHAGTRGHHSFSTVDAPRHQEALYWREAIASTYFDLRLKFRDDGGAFRGSLHAWELGALLLSQLDCGPLHYQRLAQHCRTLDAQLLVTLPLNSSVEFSQFGRTTRCAPGQFLVERSDEPYEFSHASANRMWVLKLPEDMLQTRVGNVSRFCAQHFDTTDGMGRLFADYLRLITQHCHSTHSPQALSLMGMQLIELLGMALKESPSVLESSQSVVRAAHLARIESYMRARLGDADLSPEGIAKGNGISVRYLHDLFKDTGHTVAQWMRDARLQWAHEQLTQSAPGCTVAQVAYACGFGDHTQFSHAFKRQFGQPPSAVLQQAKARTTATQNCALNAL